jgi:hypothetical protein
LTLAEIRRQTSNFEMQKPWHLSLAISLTFCFFGSPQDKTIRRIATDSFTKVEMNLSAFGVESDNFPSIEVLIDFTNDSSFCKKSYYNPAFKPSTYKLSNAELKKVLHLLQTSDLDKLKSAYKVPKSDQPTSVTTIYKGQKKYVINDYGLEGDYPLQDLYKIVYKY